MANENWIKAKKIFGAAVKVAPGERAHFLDKVCTDDVDTRREVESLLASFEEAESFMESPAIGEVAGQVIRQNEKPKSGERVAHYEIIEQIGEGGMGEVFLAKDTRLNRSVALKLLAAHITDDQNRVSRFRQEALATSALNHPNIVTIYEIGEWRGRDFIATEFIDGMTLRDVLRGKKLSIGEALDIALQTASALAAAHGAGIVHRDIKPENIMIRPDGLVKILDFGIAKYLPSGGNHKALVETEIGEVIGTAAYMSPEQARGLEIDGRTDVWSLGVIIYEMIAQKLPFAGQTKSDRIAAILEHEPAPLSKTRRQIPPQLEQIVNRALAKDKKERYAEIANLAEDLRRVREATGDKRPAAFFLPARKSAAAPRAYLYAAFVLSVLLVAAIGFGYYFWSPNKSASNAAGKKSIAVLPFVNAGNDQNAEYLSDGITESVINNLSQLSGLRVMSRGSAFRFKNNQTDTKNIAAQLGVEMLVTGDIKQLGDKLIINVRLINPGDDSQIWGNQYVKTSADIIAAQTEIAQAVAGNLRLKLTNVEQRQIGKDYTENARAYELYLRGRFHYFKVTQPEIRKAIAFFEQAIELDPNYALAYAGMADAYRTLPLAYGTPSEEGMPQARAAAEKALEIDPNLAEAHVVLGWVNFMFDWDSAAESHLKRAIEIAPNYSDAHRAYGHLLSNAGRHDEAVAEIRRARELDPLSLITGALEGQFLFYAGRDAEAFDRFKKTLDIEPNFWIAHNGLARIYIRQERYAEAVTALNKAIELSGGSPEPITQLGYAMAKSGNRERALATLEELKFSAREKYVPAYSYAMIYNGLGEREAALSYLEKSFAEREVQLSFIKIDTRWNNLRSEPRFVSLLERMNLE